MTILIWNSNWQPQDWNPNVDILFSYSTQLRFLSLQLLFGAATHTTPLLLLLYSSSEQGRRNWGVGGRPPPPPDFGRYVKGHSRTTFTRFYLFLTTYPPVLACSKGQLISKCPYGVIIWTKMSNGCLEKAKNTRKKIWQISAIAPK